VLTSLLVASLLAQADTAPVIPPTPSPVAPAPAPVATAPQPAPFTPKVVPHGVINFQLSRLSPPSPKPAVDTFEFRRARIGLKGDVTREIGFVVVYDGADDAMKDAAVMLRYLPGVELRLGQFKTPFGYEQSEFDVRLLWVYSSYAVSALARGRDSRDVGLLAAGSWRVGGPASVDLSAALVNGAGPNTKDDLDEKNVWSKAGVSLALAGTTTRLGASYGYGHQVQALGADGRFGPQGTGASATLDDTYFWFHTAGLDLTFDSPWVFVAAEKLRSRRHVTRFTTPTTSATTDVEPNGWYAGLYTRSRWNTGVILRVEEALLPTPAGTALNPGWNERTTVGVYHDVVPLTVRFIVEYEFDRSSPVVRTGDRAIAFAQVGF
jgi:hypothetical protein